jgi:hypothetical protein
MPSPALAAYALSLSNASMLAVLNAVDDFIGLGLSGRIDEIAKEWRIYADSTFDDQGGATAPTTRTQ